MAFSTIQRFLDIDIDYYALINMQGMIDLVDAVGGIEVANHFDFLFQLQKMNQNFKQKLSLEPIKSTVSKL